MNKTPSTGAPQQAETYLDRPRPAKQKGGTLLVGEITDMEAHRAALADPDRIRPRVCQSCHLGRVHVHERRTRRLRGALNGPGETQVLVVRCSRRRECGAVWRLLPSFLARHLPRRWTTVGVVVGATNSSRPGHRVPERTRQRWNARLSRSASILVALLDASGVARWRELAFRVGASGSCADLVALEPDLATLAGTLDAQLPGVRLM